MANETTHERNQVGPITIVEAIAMLHDSEISASELTACCLGQIDRLDPTLEACITVLADSAQEQARAADAALATGRDHRPLLGIPLGIKDLFQTRGIRTTAGSRVLANWLPNTDATAVTRLAEAGAIAICKTNTHEFAFGTLTPPTRNPWDTAHVPGGSSGGSAVAVATGECLGALGSDTGGSIRIPAGWCGVTGLKPTYGLVSKAGVIPLSWSLDHVGPIARTVEDCALLLDVIAGYDPTDPDSVDTSLPSYTSALAAASSPDEVIRGMRIGVPTTYFFDLLDPEVEAAVRVAIALLAALGAQVADVALPVVLDDLFPVYRAIQKPEAFTYHKDQGWLDERADLYAPEVYANILSGGDYSTPDYIRAQQTRRRFTDDMRAVFQQVDVLAMPTLAIPAPRIEDYARPLTVNGEELTSGGSLRCTFPFDLTGQPALALPCGFTASGLPISLQLVAAHFDEPALLRLGHVYQRVTDWHRRLPPIATPQP